MRVLNVKIGAMSLIIGLMMTVGWYGRLYAEPVSEKLPSGLNANAEYIPGNIAKPAILVLHGFLQTYEFLATRNIVNGLSEMDFTVLAPNLSLGVPDRKQSKQCQAAHATGFQDDLAEIEYWIKWLKQHGHTNIIMVGHSWGSQHALGYKVQHPNVPISAIIAISLVRSHQENDIHLQQIKAARKRQEQADSSLQPYKLSFCKDFMATPGSYLSYAEWNDEKVLDALKQLKIQKVPVYSIIGGADKRIDQQWVQQLSPLVTRVTVIDGANHFFSHMYEFDLKDQLDMILQSLAD
jgi:pimeloyl-ACP methyl ester carboxylesterase